MVNSTMKKILPILLIIMLCHLSSCEKDDICVDGDTPLLVIGFFDVDDTTAAKDVPSLRIRALGFETSPSTFTDRSNQDSIGIPLQIEANTTSFVFINNSADDPDDETIETGTIDTLTFNYTVNEEFVSRACGFVANFSELDTTRQVFSTDWIKRIQIVNPTVESSSAIHVKIFH